MSYGSAAELQQAVYQALLVDAEVMAKSGGAIYDAVPSGLVPPLYLSLGAEDATARYDGGGSIARHRVTVSVISDAAGFQAAKLLAAAVCEALDGSAPALDHGQVLDLHFEQARARRAGRNRKRRIDLRFAALVDIA